MAGKGKKIRVRDWEITRTGAPGPYIYRGRLDVRPDGMIVIRNRHGVIFAAQPGTGTAVRPAFILRAADAVLTPEQERELADALAIAADAAVPEPPAGERM